MEARSDVSTNELGRLELQTLVSQARLAVAACDASGHLTMFSPALERMFGWSFSTATGRQSAAVIPLLTHDGRAPLALEERPLTRARRGEVVSDAVVAADTADGRRLYLRCNAAPVRDGDDIRGAVLLVQDITLETAGRVEQEVLRHRLVDTVNHEFRTPLTKLLGHMEVLSEMSEQLPRDARWSVAVAHKAAVELRDLVLEVTGLADLGSHAKLSLTDTDLTGLLSGVGTQFAPVLRARDIELDLDVADGIRCILDPSEMTRAIIELLANAGQFAPSGSRVTLAMRRGARWIEVTVCDQGRGIPASERERLTEPFERGDHPGQPTNSKGLGLAIVRTIAAAHGGTLTLGDNEPAGLAAVVRIPRGTHRDR